VTAKSRSFLKKRTKKLSPLGSAYGTARAAEVAAPRNRDKSLFASFSEVKRRFFPLGLV
jgi:hypothetical protein